MRIFQRGSGVAVLAAAVVALAGCGDDSPSGASSDDTSSAASSASGSEDHTGDHSSTQPPSSLDDDPPGSDDDANTPPSAATITIQDFAYGDPLTVQPGQVVTVVNNDDVQHDVDAVDGTSFLTDLLAKGQSTTFTAPTAPGTYDFTCSKHPQMLGQLIVAG